MMSEKTARSLALLLVASLLFLPRLCGEEKKVDGEEAKPFSTVKPEILAKAKGREDLKELLELRSELDGLLDAYRKLALTKGTKAHPAAMRKLPSLVRDAEKLQKKLETAAQDQLEPIEKQLEKSKESEAKVLRKLDKLKEKGRDDQLREAEKEADQLRAEIEKDTETSEMVREVGMPTAQFSAPEILLLEELVKPNEQEEKSLVSFIKKEEGLVAGRLLILHLQADLEAAQQGTDEQPADKERAKAIERQLKQVNRKFAKYFLDMWKPVLEQEQELQLQKEELSGKLDALGDKPTARKYQEQLSAVSNKLQGMQRSTGLYRKIIRGTLAAEELAELEKQKKAGEPDDPDRKRSRKH